MYTINKEVSASYRDNGSKFIGYLFPALNTDLFDKKLEVIKSQYHDATHHCYAYRIDPTNIQEFAQDDGEPGGTAGLPILNRLKSAEIVNGGLIVVRYYGGTKLGKSGLIEAYGYTAKLSIEKADLQSIVPTVNMKITYPYNRQNEIDQLKSTFSLKEMESEYLADVTLTLACPKSDAQRMIDKLDRLEHLGITYENLGESFVTQ
ncbi:YigZ family protein [Aliifodinibius sp. S!AR15-10]|uniref:IMPACT family protein n=1 Tax=Aliifodinibius sp. S!AR15-10 TaxID=2950437 RepID=UPI00285FE4ED|nr:YigZ family protein [Aliifodinibius sp. S!AR15-10]MDR8391742.1 YigZ family protein [Aliifodinibius sp. S!AR15-10]